jgi:hypothetical protein
MTVGITGEICILVASGTSRVHPAIITPAIINARRRVMQFFIMVSVWREDYIIVYLCNGGILIDIPFLPLRSFYKIFSRFGIF